MSSIKSDNYTIGYSAEKVYEKLSHPENLRGLLEKVPAEGIPEEQRQTLEQIKVTEDSITIPAGPVGAMTLRLTKKEEPTLLRFDAENSPIEVALVIHIKPLSDSACEIMLEIDNVPKMLAMMASGPFKKVTDQFAQLIKQIPFE
ncbi:MAG: hypothetical protein K2N03_03605 [Muribaculaceae bacterium]|nr:hypothetical protein [Muribaculaceae bacterium]